MMAPSQANGLQNYYGSEELDDVEALTGYKTAQAVEALGGEKELLTFLEEVAKDVNVGIHEAERLIQEKGANISGTTIRRWCDELGIEWKGAYSGPPKSVDKAAEALGGEEALASYLRFAAEDPQTTYDDVLEYFNSIGIEVSKPTIKNWLDEFGIEWESGRSAACPDAMKVTLTSALHALMESSGMTTGDLAGKLGIPEKVVRFWTSGQMVPQVKAFEVLSKAVEGRREEIRKRAIAALTATSGILDETENFSTQQVEEPTVAA